MPDRDSCQSGASRLRPVPRIVRFYALHCLIGFGVAAVFTAFVLWMNVANIGYLVTHVAGGYFAATIFFLLNAFVFAGVQSGIAFWLLGEDRGATPPGGTPARADIPALALVPAVRQRR